MDNPIILDEKIEELLKEFSRRSFENAFRNYVSPLNEQEIIEELVRRARELGAAGINNLRDVLRPESDFETGIAEGAAWALAELEDSDALGLIIYQAAKVWDACAEKGGQIGGSFTFGSFLRSARKLMPGALKKGPVHEGVIKTLSIFVQHISDWRAYDSIFETAACTGSPQLRDELIKIVTNKSSDDWTKRSDALYALRHYPEMKATMLEAMGHPEHHMASKAADALVDMLGIIPGCGERDYERWKTWAMEQVPPELRVKPPTKMDILFKREPQLDRRQLFFWSACTRAHEKAMRNSKR